MLVHFCADSKNKYGGHVRHEHGYGHWNDTEPPATHQILAGTVLSLSMASVENPDTQRCDKQDNKHGVIDGMQIILRGGDIGIVLWETGVAFCDNISNELISRHLVPRYE